MVIRPVGINRKPIGDPGLNESGDNQSYSTEYLLELQGRYGSLKYRQMAKQDPMIGMILRGYKNPILSSHWTFPVPDDSTPQEKQAITLLNKWFMEDYTLGFSTLLGQILSFLEYGFSCFERTWQPWDFENTSYLVPLLAQRMQVSIQDILPKENKLTQLTTDKGLVDIPLEYMVFFTIGQQGKDLRGESILRNSYTTWKKKATYEEYMGIGFQRSMSGVPYMKVPADVDPDSKDYVAAENLLKDLAWHEDAYMIFQEGWDFGFTQSSFDPSKAQAAIDALDRHMALNAMMQFMLLGQQGGGGAYALSRDHSDMFLDGLVCLVTLIEGVFHRQIIVPFLRLNFGDKVDSSRVKLKGLNLNKKAGIELADVLEKAKNSGFIKPTIDDEIMLRGYLELPELSDEEIEKRHNPPEPLLPSDQAPTPTKKESEEDEEEDTDGTVDPDNRKRSVMKFAESSADKRQKLLDFEIKQIISFMQGHLLLIKDKLVADVRSMLSRGVTEIKGLKGIEVGGAKYRRALEMKLAGLASVGWSNAKNQAKNKAVKLSEDLNPSSLPDKELKAYIQNHAESVVDSQTTSMKIKAILTASNGPVKGLSIGQTLSNVEKVIEEFIASNSVNTAGNLMVVSSINFGEYVFNKEIGDQLWGYVFRAVDDGKTTEICLWYNGKKFSVDSAELSMVAPPLHPNCRSHLEPIYKSDMPDKPEIDDVIAPPSIQKQKSVY